VGIIQRNGFAGIGGGRGERGGEGQIVSRELPTTKGGPLGPRKERRGREECNTLDGQGGELGPEGGSGDHTPPRWWGSQLLEARGGGGEVLVNLGTFHLQSL